MKALFAVIVFMLAIAVIVFLALVCMHSALRAGRALNREIARVTEGRDRR